MMRRLDALATMLLISACEPPPIAEPIPEDVGERWADQICPLSMECGCEAYASIDECRNHIIGEFSRLEPSLRDYDEDCFEQQLQAEVHESCAGSVADINNSVPQCEVFHGTGAYGEPCERSAVLGFLNSSGTCAPGLICHPALGICRDWDPAPEPLQPGDVCSDQLFRSCLDDALYCDVDTCRELVPAGDPCFHPDACGWKDYYCQGLGSSAQGVCAPQIDLGQSCDPSEIRPCGPHSDALEWCNPATERCEAPEPLVCGIE